MPDEGQVFGQRQLDKSGGLKYVNSGGATQPLKLSEQRTAPFVRLLFQEVRNGRSHRFFGLAACARLGGEQRGIFPRLVLESARLPSGVRKLLGRGARIGPSELGRIFVAAPGGTAKSPPCQFDQVQRDSVLLLDRTGSVFAGNASRGEGRPDRFWTGDASLGNPGGHFPRSGWVPDDILSTSEPSESERLSLRALLMSVGEED